MNIMKNKIKLDHPKYHNTIQHNISIYNLHIYINNLDTYIYNLYIYNYNSITRIDTKACFVMCTPSSMQAQKMALPRHRLCA